jgi:hypothetical protein
MLLSGQKVCSLPATWRWESNMARLIVAHKIANEVEEARKLMALIVADDVDQGIQEAHHGCVGRL